MNDTIKTSLLRGRVQLEQPKEGFHASPDTVYLAAAVKAKAGDAVLDIGCGVGSAGLCVKARVAGISLTGVDVQPSLIALARRNAALNGCADACTFFEGNILDETSVPDNAFDSVLMNPPYQEGGTHTPSPKEIKAVSHGEEASGATLTDWVKYAHRKVRQGGFLTLIHRADRMDDVIFALTHRRWFGSLVVFPLYSRAGDDAKRVIVQARRERYAPFVLRAGLVIHEEDGTHTAAAKTVLEDGAGIFLL